MVTIMNHRILGQWMDMKAESVSPSDPFRRTTSSQIFECVPAALLNQTRSIPDPEHSNVAVAAKLVWDVAWSGYMTKHTTCFLLCGILD